MSPTYTTTFWFLRYWSTHFTTILRRQTLVLMDNQHSLLKNVSPRRKTFHDANKHTHTPFDACWKSNYLIYGKTTKYFTNIFTTNRGQEGIRVGRGHHMAMLMFWNSYGLCNLAPDDDCSSFQIFLDNFLDNLDQPSPSHLQPLLLTNTWNKYTLLTILNHPNIVLVSNISFEIQTLYTNTEQHIHTPRTPSWFSTPQVPSWVSPFPFLWQSIILQIFLFLRQSIILQKIPLTLALERERIPLSLALERRKSFSRGSISLSSRLQKNGLTTLRSYVEIHARSTQKWECNLRCFKWAWNQQVFSDQITSRPFVEHKHRQ